MGVQTVFDLGQPSPHPAAKNLVLSGHRVQFYEQEEVLLESSSNFLGAAAMAGDSALIITTRIRQERLLQRLGDRGMDLARVRQQNRLLCLDAASVLSEFMVNGHPSRAHFARIMEPILERLAATARSGRVAAFGEMVALLWAEGKKDAAVQLEQLWNELSGKHRFDLLCAYPMHLFSREGDAIELRKICSEHSRVIPAESYTGLANEEERAHAILLLQQKARALETEVLEHSKARRVLEEREANLRDFLENAVLGMHWLGPGGTILWANRAEMEMLGYRREEYIGHHISEFHADPAVIDDILTRLRRNEVVKGYEARLRHKDSSVRDVRIDSSVWMQDGKIVQTRCFTVDLTEKKRAEEGCLRLAAIVESSEDGIASKDLNGIVTSWNAAAERIFGYRAEEIVGRSIELIIPQNLLQEEPLILAKVRAGERLEHFETVRVTKAGKLIDVSLTVSPVKDKTGRVIGVAKIVRDITQRKQLEASLRTTERLASLGKLAATVAHEINNPLEAVVNFIYLARQSPEIPQEASLHLKCADEELARVAHIAQQTLGFYRDTSSPVWLILSEVVDDVLNIYRHKLAYKGLAVRKEIQDGLALRALQGELKQILSNLIANAIDASGNDAPIYLRARAVSRIRSGCKGIRITVADEGGGIPAEAREKLFTPFCTTKKDVGNGLGLWITRDLLERRGGGIRFRTRNGHKSGTVMSAFLPLALPVSAEMQNG